MYMSLKKKIKQKLTENKSTEPSDTIDLWEGARHAIDIIEKNNKWYLIIVKYNDLQGQVVNTIDLGSNKNIVLRKAGFILGDKVLKNIDLSKEYQNE